MQRLIQRIANALGLLSLLVTTSASAADAAPASGPAIWQVADEDTVIYLFGTVHALPPGTNWMDQRIAAKLAAADELVTEVPVSKAGTDASDLRAMAELPKGQNLRALLAPAELDAYVRAMGTLGLPVDSFDRYEPWYVAMMLSLLPIMRHGYTAAAGVEGALEASLPSERKRVALETIEYQLGLLDTLPAQTQASYLHEISNSVPEMGATVGAMVQAWLKGDADELAKLMNPEASDPVLLDRLLYQRNRNWAKWVKARLDKPGTAFVAVGAGHLAGPGSLQSVLAADGIASQRLP